jgi:hypothetical protein
MSAHSFSLLLGRFNQETIDMFEGLNDEMDADIAHLVSSISKDLTEQDILDLIADKGGFVLLGTLPEQQTPEICAAALGYFKRGSWGYHRIHDAIVCQEYLNLELFQ